MNDLELPLNTLKVLERRYLLKDDARNTVEIPLQLFRRVAKAISQAEKRFKDRQISPQVVEEKFFTMMRNLEFMPNSPTLMNAGTAVNQLAACFVLPVDDSIESIFKTLRNMAAIHQTGGGTGFDFSHLRPKGDLVYSTKGEASGPVSFMSIYDAATGVIVQGGKRRGANMGILRVDHPDIVEFIEAKLEEGRFSNFNLSVAITDAFMQAVYKNKKYSLINPRTKKKVKEARAREIFNLIVNSAWRCGDPGLIFIDEINRHNPTPGAGKIEATNPCLSAENWIMTSKGPRKIKDLIGRKFSILTNGRFYPVYKNGFFSTGNNSVFNLITREGYELEATENHLILKVEKMTRYSIETAWVKLIDLKSGDKIVINNHRDLEDWPGEYTEKEGYLIGLLIGDGTFMPERAMLYSWPKVKGQETVRNLAFNYLNSFPHWKDFKGWIGSGCKGKRVKLSTAYLKDLVLKLDLRPRQKKITEKMEAASSSFYKGFLAGLFDCDGAVIGNQARGVSIRLAQSDFVILQTVQRMLLRLGICSVIYKNRRSAGLREMPDGKGGTKYYYSKTQHELVISNENIYYFAKKIGFVDSKKAKKLKEIFKKFKRKLNRERFVVTVKEIEYSGKKQTYDISVPGINRFDANGIVVHNCGELPLLAYESCNLGSLNLAKFVTDKREVDWHKLSDRIKWAVRFLDNVIEVNKFPLPEIKDATLANRKIGLGVMGFADMLILLGIPYNSKEAVRFAGSLMRFIHKESLKASTELAKTRGVFSNFKKSIYARTNLRLRNATVNTIAPTGSISIIAGCSSGIEPLFAISFTRNVLSGTRLFEINYLFERLARQKRFFSDRLMKEISQSGSIQNIKGIPSDIKKIFITAFDVEPNEHLYIQAAFQRYTDNSVSKTVNLAAKATAQDVRKIYLLAHKLKCKGITIYRYGTKKEQVLTFYKGATEENRTVTAASEYAGGCAREVCA